MTLFICLGILLLKWVVAEVSAVIFCALLFTLFAVFVLALCEEDEVEFASSCVRRTCRIVL